MGSAKQFAGTIHNLQDIDRRVPQGTTRSPSLLVKLDRLIIGLILRSKLVFLIISSRMRHSSGMRAHDLRVLSEIFDRKPRAVQHSAECVDIDNESNQVP